MNLRYKLKELNNLINNVNHIVRTNEDNFCLQLIHQVLHHGSYLPMTHMSLRPFALAFLMNEMMVNNRQHIIEFGTGISTILNARFIKMNKLPATIVSVDDNEGWIDFIRKCLEKENLGDIVTMIHAPLKNKELNGNKNIWYDTEAIQKAMSPNENFDMVLIDGPPRAMNHLTRYFALPFIWERLKENYVIFLDDAHRKGEQQMIRMWVDQFKIPFKIHGSTLGVCYAGPHFHSDPLKFSSTI